MRRLLAFAFVTALLFPASSQADGKGTAIEELESQGVSLIHQFETPMGLKGYIGKAQGQTLTFYASPDDQYLILGTLMDRFGNNLSEKIVLDEIVRPRLEDYWTGIEDAQWVQDGSPDADLIFYTFTDPNCPYCAHFRQQIHPWIESKEIQLRHIMVGMLAEDSIEKSAMILESANPGELLERQQKTMRQGGIETDPTLVSKGYVTVKEHNNLMGDLGFDGTPVTVYRDRSGQLQMIRGILDAGTLEKLRRGDF